MLRSTTPKKANGGNGGRAAALPAGHGPSYEGGGIDPDACALLLDMERALHGVSMPADQVEDHVRAMAAGLGMTAEVFTMQSFAATELQAGEARRLEIRRIPFDPHWNLRRLSELVALAQGVADRHIAVPEARAQMRAIVARPNPNPRWLVLVAYAVYGGAVAVRVGGRWREMAVGAFIGAIAGAVHFGSAATETVDLEKSFLGALAGTLAVFAAAAVMPPFDAPQALFGGITLLVPAMALTIGLNELASGAVESGVVRLFHSLLRFLMLGFGIAAAVNLSRLIGPWPAHVTTTPLPLAVELVFVAIGGLALVVCLQGRPADVFWIVLACVVAHGTHALTKRVMGGGGSPFVASFVLAAVAYLHARWTGRLPATMIVPGFLQLAPGFLGTEAVMNNLRPGTVPSAGTFFDVFLVALQLGTGVLVAGLIFRKRAVRVAASRG